MPAADAPAAPLVAEPPPPLDPRFVKDTSKSLVELYSSARSEWIEATIAQLNLPKETSDRIVALARVQAGTQNTVVECTPAVLESMGVDSRKYPLAVFAIAALFDTLQFGSCLAMLRRMKVEAVRPTPPPPDAAKPPPP